jgi:hypothetical protein
MSLLKYQNKRRNDTIIAAARNEYEKIIALIEKKFNESIDLLYKDINSRIASLRVQHDEQLAEAWKNYVTSITPYLKENQWRVLAEAGIYPITEDVREIDGDLDGEVEEKDLIASSST